jgi:hypothetical protein
MSAICPYCGAKLNLGLKFCVVCGRHITQDRALGKLSGGLKAGFRPADITRRLDELITVARFKKSRRNQTVERGSRFLFLNVIYLLAFSGLFYAAIQFSLETLFPGKYKESRIPVAKIMTFMQQKATEVHTKVTELTAPPATDAPAPAPLVATPEKAAAKPAYKPSKASSKKKSKKKQKRRRTGKSQKKG